MQPFTISCLRMVGLVVNRMTQKLISTEHGWWMGLRIDPVNFGVDLDKWMDSKQFSHIR